jgi:hypothetical protein
MSDDTKIISFENHPIKRKIKERDGMPKLSKEMLELMDDIFTPENITGFLCVLEGLRQIGDYVRVDVDQESVSMRITQFLDTVADAIEKTSEISQMVSFDFDPEQPYSLIAPDARKAAEMLTYWTDGENAPTAMMESEEDAGIDLAKRSSANVLNLKDRTASIDINLDEDDTI